MIRRPPRSTLFPYTTLFRSNRPGDNCVGSIGKPFGEIEVKIAEDGEILVRGRTVMRGYYGHPESTEAVMRSEEHTSELQSPCNLVCRLLLEKKKTSREQTLRCKVVLHGPDSAFNGFARKAICSTTNHHVLQEDQSLVPLAAVCEAETVIVDD